LYVEETNSQVRGTVEPSIMHYFRTVSQQAKLGQRDQSASYAYLREVRQRMGSITWEEIDQTMGVYGNAETCIRKLQEAHAQCAMDQVVCWFNPGGLIPHRQVLASMKRFVTEVMPAVRGL